MGTRLCCCQDDKSEAPILITAIANDESADGQGGLEDDGDVGASPEELAHDFPDEVPADGYGEYGNTGGDYLYKGEWFGGKFDGEGCIVTPEYTYSGQWLEGLRHGKGEMRSTEGTVYVGEMRSGKMHGLAKLSLKDGTVYEGDFDKNEVSGIGIKTWTDGRRYKGEWRCNQMHGRGVFKFPDGRIYDGHYVQGLRHGRGIMRWPDGRQYEGPFHRDMQDGIGTATGSSGRKRQGVWEEGKWLEWREVDETEEPSTSGENPVLKREAKVRLDEEPGGEELAEPVDGQNQEEPGDSGKLAVKDEPSENDTKSCEEVSAKSGKGADQEELAKDCKGTGKEDLVQNGNCICQEETAKSCPEPEKISTGQGQDMHCRSGNDVSQDISAQQGQMRDEQTVEPAKML